MEDKSGNCLVSFLYLSKNKVISNTLNMNRSNKYNNSSTKSPRTQIIHDSDSNDSNSIFRGRANLSDSSDTVSHVTQCYERTSVKHLHHTAKYSTRSRSHGRCHRNRRACRTIVIGALLRIILKMTRTQCAVDCCSNASKNSKGLSFFRVR